ncbi:MULTISPECIES: hypothetical protein [unclassified Arthrobacter]|uniref:hypothetical protein n=1 Tax=unclassified Arthrobacter TaxID=235627 RepID=UPI0014927357|nr:MULTISPECIES: hypothetical protein [unclassified Arthrobacter]MBE0009617.1 hypothetical protein [Arthrobacter sp. AET 35A]NOJ63370.1 hypothetical protein [Arthrobacter sp. 147(2020)]
MSTIYEGMITKDMTPIAFEAAKNIDEMNTAYSSSPEKDLQGFVDILMNQNRQLIKAVGLLEQRVNIMDGKIVDPYLSESTGSR